MSYTYLYNHFDSGQRGGEILWMRRANSDRNTASIQAAIESCYQVYSCKGYLWNEELPEQKAKLFHENQNTRWFILLRHKDLSQSSIQTNRQFLAVPNSVNLKYFAFKRTERGI